MFIKAWGSRGSIPVSGNEYLKYGGDTTCIEVTAETGETIIVDAGTGIRRLGDAFMKNGKTRYYLLFTHVHWDHIMGLAFFSPLFDKQSQIIIQDRQFLHLNTRDLLKEVMKQPFFPICLDDLNADIRFEKSLNNTFNIGSICIETILLSHTSRCLGYKFTEDEKSFVFFTDHELGFNHPGSRSLDTYLKFAENADLLLHDAEYTSVEYKGKIRWGHSTIPQALDFALKARVKKFGLFHLDKDRTDSEMDKIVSDCKTELRKNSSTIDCFAVPCNFETTL